MAFPMLLILFAISFNEFTTSDNATPLHWAASNNSKEIGEILISKRADINAKDIIYQIIIILFLINII